MFDRLSVKNFQAHSKTIVDLDPHVTTIVGRSDVGKSALLRALRWVCLNDPQGTEFIKTGKKLASVTLDVDGHRIKRIRGKANQYKLDDEVFVAFKTVPPENVSSVLRVTELNFQEQHDGPFWFSEAPAAVGKQLNAIVDLSVIDSTLAKLAKNLRSTKSAVNVSFKMLNDADKEIDQTKWAVKASHAYNDLMDLQDAIDQTGDDSDRLMALLAELEMNEQWMAEIDKMTDQFSIVKDIMTRWLKVEGNLALIEVDIDALNHQSVIAEPPEMLDCSELLREIKDTTEKITELVQPLTMLYIKEKQIPPLEQEMEETETRIKEQSEGLCPLCRNPAPSLF